VHGPKPQGHLADLLKTKQVLVERQTFIDVFDDHSDVDAMLPGLHTHTDSPRRFPLGDFYGFRFCGCFFGS
jgi:hypothetical protein